MRYLIQDNTFKEHNHAKLIAILERMGLEYEVAKYVPIAKEILFEMKANDVFCFGAVAMAHAAKKYDWYPGSMYNDNHDFEVYGPKYGEYMLNADSMIMGFGDPLPEDWPWVFFARPTGDTKAFTGKLFTQDAWKASIEYVNAAETNDPRVIRPGTRVQVCKSKEIYQEIRCWVVGGKVVTISQYAGGTRGYKNLDNEDPEAREFAQAMVDIYQPADSFCIDVCRTPNGFKIVEVNCINCSGFYDADMQKLVEALEERYSFVAL